VITPNVPAQPQQPIQYSIKNNTVLYNTIFIICIIIIVILGLIIIGYIILKKKPNLKDRFNRRDILVTRTITETSSDDNEVTIDDICNIELAYNQDKQQTVFRKSKPKRKKKKLMKKKNSPIKNMTKNKMQLSLPTITEVLTCEDESDYDSNSSEDDMILGVTTLLYEDDGFITDDVVNLSALQFLETKSDVERPTSPEVEAITKKLVDLKNDTIVSDISTDEEQETPEEDDEMNDNQTQDINPIDEDDLSCISDISISIDDDEIQIIAPPGHLYLDINLNESGNCYVHNISNKSPLYGEIQVGDVIVQIDDVCVLGWNAISISKFLAERAVLEQRVITVRRC